MSKLKLYTLNIYSFYIVCQYYISKKLFLKGYEGFLGGSVVKNLPANAEDMGSIPGLERSPAGGNGNPLQCSCLGNARDGRALWAAIYGVAQSWTQLK